MSDSFPREEVLLVLRTVLRAAMPKTSPFQPHSRPTTSNPLPTFIFPTRQIPMHFFLLRSHYAPPVHLLTTSCPTQVLCLETLITNLWESIR